MRIRPETPDLERAIRDLLLAAFPTPAEADLVDRLRRDGDLAIALAAIDDDDAVVGYVALSPMTAPMKALGLGPVAVAPDHRRRGVGSALIHQSLDSAKACGVEAIFVLGDRAYYSRFGFDAETASGFALSYAGPYFMALSLTDAGLSARSGRVDYAPAFSGLT